MLHSVATIVSLIVVAGALALIVGLLVDEWHAIRKALCLGRAPSHAPLPNRIRAAADRTARLMTLSPQPAPQRAAA